MKNRICALSLLLTLCVSFCLIPALADDLWSEEYYRACDLSEQLSEAERDSLDADCIAFMKEHQVDVALLGITNADNDGAVSDEDAKGYYDSCVFGYGENRDGFLWIYNFDTNLAQMFCYGAAEGMIPQETIDRAVAHAPKLREEHGVYGALYCGLGYLKSALDSTPEQPAETGTAATDSASGVERIDQGSNKPSWYPDSTENFPFYHDENAPRVVDNADIFTDAEEQSLEARIGEIRRELQRDIVVYTDVTDYGLGHDVCAADFFDFNGYGYGDEREGVCLFIDMDPNNRGWWCCATGSVTRGLYTEEVANLIDDALYDYMAAGAYGTGVSDWVENIRMLYRKGTPFAPEWYPEPGETITPFHDPNAPRVVDELGVLSESEVAALTAQAAEIAQKRGVDVAIHTMNSPVGLSYDEVAAQYYRHMGYGTGDNYDGILLSVFKRPGYLATTRITAFGSAADKLTEKNRDRLRDFLEDKTDKKEYYAGLSQWLRQVDHMERTGRVPRSTAYWGFITALSVAFGSIFGGASLGSAKKKMEPPKAKREADAYIDSKTSTIRDAGRHYLFTTTSRRYDPPKETSSRGSSGSSGRSSYSSHYHGSSGASHSGSGRRF